MAACCCCPLLSSSAFGDPKHKRLVIAAMHMALTLLSVIQARRQDLLSNSTTSLTFGLKILTYVSVHDVYTLYLRSHSSETVLCDFHYFAASSSAGYRRQHAAQNCTAAKPCPLASRIAGRHSLKSRPTIGSAKILASLLEPRLHVTFHLTYKNLLREQQQCLPLA